MCDFTKGFKFCACSEENNVAINNSKYIWTLCRFLENDLVDIVGKMVIPKQYSGKAITIDILLEKLNSNNCFDFEYKPSENDTFNVTIPVNDAHGGSLNCIYKNSKWEMGEISPFLGESTLIKYGVLEKINTTSKKNS